MVIKGEFKVLKSVYWKRTIDDEKLRVHFWNSASELPFHDFSRVFSHLFPALRFIACSFCRPLDPIECIDPPIHSPDACVWVGAMACYWVGRVIHLETRLRQGLTSHLQTRHTRSSSFVLPRAEDGDSIKLAMLLFTTDECYVSQAHHFVLNPQDSFILSFIL